MRWVRAPRLIAATADATARRSRRFERSGWEIWSLPTAGGGIDLTAFARRASDEGLIDLFVEPGPTLAASFLDGGPVDRILLFIAPKILGAGMGWSDRLRSRRLQDAIRAAFAAGAEPIGDDLLLEIDGRSGRPIVPPRRPGNALHSP